MKIVLICAGGMSSSILSSRMTQAIIDKGLDASVSAHGVSSVEKHAVGADVVLVGPQIRYMLPIITQKVSPIPVAMIDMRDYGTANANNVLNQALALIKETYNERL